MDEPGHGHALPLPQGVGPLTHPTPHIIGVGQRLLSDGAARVRPIHEGQIVGRHRHGREPGGLEAVPFLPGEHEVRLEIRGAAESMRHLPTPVLLPGRTLFVAGAIRGRSHRLTKALP